MLQLSDNFKAVADCIIKM